MKSEISYVYSPMLKKSIKLEHKDDCCLMYKDENKPDIKKYLSPTKHKTPEFAEIAYYLKESSEINNQISKLEQKLRRLQENINIKELQEKFPEYFL